MSPRAAADVLVTGAGVAAPGAGAPEALLERPDDASPVEPRDLVGKRGLRYKDRATQLAYCAADTALRDSGILGDEGLTVPSESVGVVASSNLGNIDTVCGVVDTLAAETVTGTSPMDLPNASSNVVASSVAIRFGLRGPNLMECNGVTSGLDALRWANLMIKAGRASRMLVVGTEPDNPAVRELIGGPAIDGAAAVLLEAAAVAGRRDARPRATVGRYLRTAGPRVCAERLASSGQPALWQAPESADIAAGDAPRQDVAASRGSASGALGVLQCVAAVAWFDRGGAGPVYALAGHEGADATAGLVLDLPEEAR